MVLLSYFFITSVILFSGSGPGTAPAEQCEVPDFKGLRLGMLEEEILALFPKAKSEPSPRKGKYYRIEVANPFQDIKVRVAEIVVNTTESCVTDVWITLHTSTPSEQLEAYFRNKWGEPQIKGSAKYAGVGRRPLVGWDMGCGVDISFYPTALGMPPRLTYTESLTSMINADLKPCSNRPPA